MAINWVSAVSRSLGKLMYIPILLPPHLHLHTHTHIHTRTCTHTHAHAHVHTHTHTHTHTCMHTHMYTIYIWPFCHEGEGHHLTGFPPAYLLFAEFGELRDALLLEQALLEDVPLNCLRGALAATASWNKQVNNNNNNKELLQRILQCS